MEESISVIMDLHWRQDQNIDSRLTKYGIADGDTGRRKRMIYLLAKYDVTGVQGRRARIKVINIHRRRRRDQYLIKFGAPIGGIYIDVLEFRREYFC